MSRPQLASRYLVRPLALSDILPCAQLQAHSFAYHNLLDAVYKLPAFQSIGAFGLMTTFHSYPDALSFVVVDRECQPKQPHVAHDYRGASVYDHDADAATLDPFLVACLISHDASRQMNDDDVNASAPHSVEFDYLFELLYAPQHDLRKDPQHPLHHMYEPQHTGKRKAQEFGVGIHAYLLAVHDQHVGQKLGFHLALALYDEAKRRGYEYLYVECTHAATEAIFTRPPLNGIVTHKVRADEIVLPDKHRRQSLWRDIPLDVTSIYVPIKHRNAI